MVLISLLCLIFALPLPALAQGTNVPWIPIQFLNASGAVCNGCLLDTWAAGTSTAEATYSDSTLSTANANPVVMDSSGRPTSGGLYLSATSYRFRLRTSAGATLWTLDNVTSVPTASGNTDISCVAGEAITLGQVVYLSDGSGSLTAGRCYLADSDNLYSSTTAPIIGIATAAISSAASGTVRIGGRMTGLSGLTAGLSYYIGATAGALVSTLPTANARFVGGADSTTTLIMGSQPDQFTTFRPPQGRCTLTTAVPVTTADVTAATTLYYALYGGNQLTLYTGTRWVSTAFSELSLAVPATTNTMYDVFIDYTAGVPALEAVAWTNDTTRATALTTQNGVYVQTSDADSLYVCSFRTTGSSGQTEDSFAKRYVWNYYNRVPRLMRVTEATDTWTYTTATIRQANGAAANQLDFVVGVAEVALDATVIAIAQNSMLTTAAVGIGIDSTSTFTTGNIGGLVAFQVVDRRQYITAQLLVFPAVGRHTASWNEYSAAVGTTTWTGDDGTPTIEQAGIHGRLEM